MSQLYKEARQCKCGYTTSHRGAWSTHKRLCKVIQNELGSIDKERIASLEQQLAIKDRQIEEYRKEIERLLAERCTELNEEVKRLRKSKRGPKRIHRTEPERRKIAKRQNWMCAGKECPAATRGEELEEYDIDHIIPLSRGGSEDPGNLQALCPGCHRKKTEQEWLVSP